MRDKFGSRALEGFLLGYSNNSKSYLIADCFIGAELITKCSCKVEFNKTSFPEKTTSQTLKLKMKFFSNSTKGGVKKSCKKQNQSMMHKT